MRGIRRHESHPGLGCGAVRMNRNVGASFGLSVLTVLFFAVVLYQPARPPTPPTPAPAQDAAVVVVEALPPPEPPQRVAPPPQVPTVPKPTPAPAPATIATRPA